MMEPVVIKGEGILVRLLKLPSIVIGSFLLSLLLPVMYLFYYRDYVLGMYMYKVAKQVMKGEVSVILVPTSEMDDWNSPSEEEDDPD